jgi:hypothetical protein
LVICAWRPSLSLSGAGGKGQRATAADRLPAPQRRALRVAFGLESRRPADPFLVGLAVLTLLADAAEVRPVLCVVDDAQWLDDASADILSFVARRLLADRVGMLFAMTDIPGRHPHVQALPELRMGGLPEEDADKLLASTVGQPLSAGVGRQIVADTGGNLLALIEVARALTPEQLSGFAPLPEPLPLGRQLEERFARRVRDFPRTPGRCCCWRPRTSRARATACGGRPPRWASPSPPRGRRRRRI